MPIRSTLLHSHPEMPAEWASARRAWELQEVTTAAMGCEAALKPADSVVSDAPRRPFLLPVPDSSQTSPLPCKLSVARPAQTR
ncbi:hypothetical protein PLA107_025590 [Pseudomonas amygdali pv. lachrymans str. M301315]|uniref:Uncharacterized protein n=1 Tax=Pseudomonas amygdali pv. lachrymans str. M301315 TaxID=629260 RepID=A0AAD0M214_PSEAV|nr:hypothetical protein PLA107_025590 [Pseudomonas amygdali pv. lachrymans str. M301315]